jgi:succinate-semialdehyde dehydrogenase/glutarate-semialdehyde dehydrogenase
LITPWNYPFLLSVADSLPALLAGNAVIVKPSELTPLSAVLARSLLIDSGLDPSLALLVHGGAAAGAELIRQVDYIGFTGGNETGRKVAMAAAERLIPFSLELGGKNPMIVLEGTSLDDAASGMIAGAFANGGQTCISVERVYVQQSIYHDFASRVRDLAGEIKLGWSKGWDMQMGSMISDAHASKVLNHIRSARDAGAKVLTGGNARMDLGSAFVEPTILENVSESMPVAREETFGPVVSLFPVRNADEAIQKANDSLYGLNASVWAQGRAEGLHIARQLETGSAAINSTLLIYNSFDVPMGGVKQSGIGRRHGEHGILRYTQSQSIVGSFASRGGYDALAVGTNSQRMADFLLRAARLWRRIPGIR